MSANSVCVTMTEAELESRAVECGLTPLELKVVRRAIELARKGKSFAGKAINGVLNTACEKLGEG